MISTSRLEIKPWSEELAAHFLELTRDEGFNLFPITVYRQTDLNTARDWIQHALNLNKKTKLGKWAVWERSSGTLIGMGGLTPWLFEGQNLVDITYRLRQSAWGKGYGIETAKALVEYGFNDLKLNEITATITPDNIASKNIATKLGMKFDKLIILQGITTELYRLQHS